MNRILVVGEKRPISKEKFPKAEEQYEIAKSRMSQGQRTESTKHAVKAYNTLYF